MFPMGMTEHQYHTRCLCGASQATPAYRLPGEFWAAQPPRWHTPSQCGEFESGRPPRPDFLRAIGENESDWQRRLVMAYPVVS